MIKRPLHKSLLLLLIIILGIQFSLLALAGLADRPDSFKKETGAYTCINCQNSAESNGDIITDMDNEKLQTKSINSMLDQNTDEIFDTARDKDLTRSRINQVLQKRNEYKRNNPKVQKTCR